MGVVYKINEEVCQFIIEQKRICPEISCRKLAEAVDKRFQAKLSKSSVNSILKSAHLSSPVGRPRFSRKKKPAKFQLPEEKKLLTMGAPRQADAFGMGYVFVKAMEWELASESVFGKRLAETCHLVPGQAAFLAENLLFCEALGLEKPDSISEQIKNSLLGLEGNEEKDFLRLLAGAQSQSKELNIKLSIDFQQIHSLAHNVELVLADGKKVILDINLTSVWPENAVFSINKPINSALTSISAKIINNVQSVILCFSPLLNKQNNSDFSANFSPEFLDFCMAFENQGPKRIQQINITNGKGQQVFTFDKIIQKKRNFVAAVWDSQKGFAFFLPLLKGGESKEITVAHLDKTWFFSEHLMSVGQREDFQPILGVRVFLLRTARNASPKVFFMTNASKEVISATQAIEGYFQAWPYGERIISCEFGDSVRSNGMLLNYNQNEKDAFLAKQTHDLEQKTDDIRQISKNVINIYTKMLKKYYFSSNCQDFSLSAMRERFYGLPGWQRCRGGVMEICLNPPADYTYRDELVYAATRVNERDIRDFSGRKVFVRVD